MTLSMSKILTLLTRSLLCSEAKWPFTGLETAKARASGCSPLGTAELMVAIHVHLREGVA